MFPYPSNAPVRSVVAEFARAPEVTWSGLGLAGQIVGFGVPCVWLANLRGPASTGATVVASLGTATLIGIASWLSVRTLRDRDIALHFYEHGLTFHRRGAVVAIDFAEIREVRSALEVERSMRNGKRKWSVDRHVLRMRGGREVEVLAVFPDNASVLQRLYAATQHITREARAALDAGGSPVFGPFVVSSAGVRLGEHSLRWSDVESAELVVQRDPRRTRANVVVRGGLTELTAPLADVPNAHALLALLRR